MAEDKEANAFEVALDLPNVFDSYHYKIPNEMLGRARLGMRVLVPVRGRQITGYLLKASEPPEGIKLKAVIDLLDEVPLFDLKMLELLTFAASYLFHPLGEVIRGALPAGINVESRQKVELTETGRIAAIGSVLRGPKAAILEFLNEFSDKKKGILTKKVLKSVKGARHYHIRELARDGFVEAQVHLSKPRNSLKRLRFYVPVQGVSLARRATVLKRSLIQQQAMNFLLKHGESDVASIKEALGKSVGGALRGLLKKGLVDVEEREVNSDPFLASVPLKEAPELTSDQSEALKQVLPGMDSNIFQSFLLHGVTGSGKTELYIRLIERNIELGRQAIVLVPEISLTPQFVHNFRARLGDQLTVLHSRLSERERLSQWWRIRRGEVPLVIGARSAIFAPFANLGVIVVDEEQEGSYKQEGRFPYNARNLALVRGKICGATVVLGSATPAMESYANARRGKWGYLSLPKRISGRSLPEIEVVDLRQAGQRIGGVISPHLEERVNECLEQGDQTILLLNRRGYHTSVLCTECGYSFRCRHCSVGLTFHRGQNLLICHYCGYAESLPEICPQCQTPEVEFLGLGTEKVEELLNKLFPTARIQRMDRDTTSRKGALESIISQFGSREIDILIGTQMIAKGHDFPGVTLVGVLLADQSMNLPDFRSAERTFQLLMQVSGRAGRGEKPGRVVIQTFNPEHPSITQTCAHEYEQFYLPEAELRRSMGYPPFGWLVAIRFEGEDPEETRRTAEFIGRAAIEKLHTKQYPGVVFLGPAPAPIERIKRRFRWQMLFKGGDRRPLHKLIWAILLEAVPEQPNSGVKIMIDADPLQML